MHISLLDFVSQNYIPLLLIAGVAIATISSRKSPIPAISTVWIILALLFFRVFVGYINDYAWEHARDALEIRYWTSISEYIINPLLFLMELLLIIKKKWVRILVMIPSVLNMAILLLPPLFGMDVITYNETFNMHRTIFVKNSIAINVIYLVLFTIASFIHFRTYPRSDQTMLWFIFIATGLTFYLEYEGIIIGYLNAVIAVDVLFYYMFLNMAYQTELEGHVLKQDLELAKTNARLMQEQISPHFIYNALYIIKALIWVDRSKASDAIENFSVYLRRNIDSLRSSELIPFENELAHIEAFLAIETADESKPIQVIYDIKESDFSIPALTAEPLVENAIIHGIFKIKEPGILKISSYRDGDNHVVEIRDNGPGFKDRPSERTGVGINNVRTRMKLQCNGTLEFEAPEGGGTVARLKIPVTTPPLKKITN